jgi:hypothetical protein
MAGKRPKGSPERISTLLTGPGLTPELGARLKDLAIWESWDQAVGPAIAGRARPLRLVGGVLTVVVASGPWMQQLSFMKTELRERINTLLGNERVKEIVLKAGRIQHDTVITEAPRPVPKPLSAHQQAQIATQVSGLEDAELRRSLQSLIELHLRNS